MLWGRALGAGPATAASTSSTRGTPERYREGGLGLAPLLSAVHPSLKELGPSRSYTAPFKSGLWVAPFIAKGARFTGKTFYVYISTYIRYDMYILFISTYICIYTLIATPHPAKTDLLRLALAFPYQQQHLVRVFRDQRNST